jgi:small subunit ribosomal protein S1
MDGLIHISELSWSHVNHPSEVLEIGQDVQVKVLDIDRERQRISLGLKQTQSDPWQQVVEAYDENDVVQGKVTKVVTFGAFVEIMPGVEGLVHISELAQHHVENPREVVSQGDVVNVKIIEVDAERRRLSLSLKRVDDSEEVQPRADGQPLETPAPPQIDLSDDVFAEERTGEEATDEALAEIPVAESTPDIPAAEPEQGGPESEPAEPEQAATDASIDADAVDPTHQGPGDSEGHAPYAPDEAEQPEEK